ncbi:complex I NDUFA9 subunit family protein [Halobacterium litoreum]|uniref:Complex I NDUFA9 subunit family protein n=1 Tax=Halobacterium litoreum TaxID=2039234 RepID=A0ABD5NEE1_9EURY|nr:complex I NDUFA9 subunit family protein [Halobacterium litoreum]UHH13733.1 complex I NDUFA9 subunit family protein [Halobacterium litoreum]
MDVLVTGGTGFIGTHLCRELDERGHDVTALSRHPEGADLPDSVETAVGDVTAYDAVAEAMEGKDAVVNLVALSPLFKPNGGDRRHFEVHLGGTENVVTAAEEAGADYVLQMSALGADPDGSTAYLRSKGQAETVVRESELEYTIFRPSVVFGDGGEFVGFTKQLTTPYVTGLPGGGKSKFQPIWVQDLVPMLADAVGDETHWGETYEIGGPEVLSLADVTHLAYRAEGKSVRVLPVPMPLAGIGLTLADPLPFVPFGSDQYRSLKFDNTVAENDIAAFGVDESDLTTLSEYLSLK